MKDLGFYGAIPLANADTIRIDAPDGHVLLRLNIVDGILKADYDPSDLDEAARVFLRELVRIHNAGPAA